MYSTFGRKFEACLAWYMHVSLDIHIVLIQKLLRVIKFQEKRKQSSMILFRLQSGLDIQKCWYTCDFEGGQYCIFNTDCAQQCSYCVQFDNRTTNVSQI